jgi:hypothetical protein
MIPPHFQFIYRLLHPLFDKEARRLTSWSSVLSEAQLGEPTNSSIEDLMSVIVQAHPRSDSRFVVNYALPIETYHRAINVVSGLVAQQEHLYVIDGTGNALRNRPWSVVAGVLSGMGDVEIFSISPATVELSLFVPTHTWDPNHEFYLWSPADTDASSLIATLNPFPTEDLLSPAFDLLQNGREDDLQLVLLN